MTGPSSAEIWSRALGRTVVYAGDDLDAWEAQARRMLPPFLVFDLRLMYELFQKSGFMASPGDIERLTRLLGHAPRRFEDFAREMAAVWKS